MRLELGKRRSALPVFSVPSLQPSRLYLNKSSRLPRAQALPAVPACCLALDCRPRGEKAYTCSSVLGATRASAAVCTRIGRWFRTTRTECSRGDRRRSDCSCRRLDGKSEPIAQREQRNSSCDAISSAFRARGVLQLPARRARVRPVLAPTFRAPSHDRAGSSCSRAAGTSGRSCDDILSPSRHSEERSVSSPQAAP